MPNFLARVRSVSFGCNSWLSFFFLIAFVFLWFGCAKGGHGNRPGEGEDPGQTGGPGGGGAAACGGFSVEVPVESYIPPVVLVIDRSGTMRRKFILVPEDEDNSETESRWVTVCKALLHEPQSVIPRIGHQVPIGVSLYYGYLDDHDDIEGEWPRLEYEPPALNNVDDIVDMYQCDNRQPGGATPTAEAITETQKRVRQALGANHRTVRFVLITDGDPDHRDYPQSNIHSESGEIVHGLTVKAIQDVRADGIETLIINLAGLFPDIQNRRLEELANAGAGRDPQAKPPSTSWSPSTSFQLRDALTRTVTKVPDCELELQGQITNVDEVCSGTVRLHLNHGSQVLQCNDRNGWELIDPRHIRLRGRACSEFRRGAGARIEAEFPCHVAELI